MLRLNNETLKQVSGPVPGYDRTSLKAGIVHLGIGAFHRGHQADYTDKLLNEKGGDWGIIGASLRSPGVRNQLQPQDGLYCLIEKDSNHAETKVVGAIQSVLVAPEAPQQLINALSDPDIKVVTLTITEKGYCHNPGTPDINWENPDILWDLEHYQTAPKSAIGYIVAALEQRQKLEAPITLLSCDNLSHNGKLLKNVVNSFVQRVNPSIAEWLEQHVAFPCSMVDRIVPAVTEQTLLELQDSLGVSDQGAVVTEPFSQWVIEDHFASDKPDWESVGAMLVDDVAPFEEMKLRLLNGSHSIIAYLGYLSGYDYVHQVMGDPDLKGFVQDYMALVTPTLNVPDGFDLDAYKQELLDRFSNASLNHRTDQIAQDGSQKIPQRWLASARQLLNDGVDASLLALALAGWIRYLQGVRDPDSSGARASYDIIDPFSEALMGLVKGAEAKGVSPVTEVLGLQAVFGSLPQDQADWSSQVEKYYAAMEKEGVLNLLKERNNTMSS
ncbi:mannitol dehydrogenase family protein [Pseudomaricurvus sp.]|uniref:mannitol dehydrogenase family protein n=1 Tax=Pseudomaricurvus sp. TaxID=2004510 RepID=UPI003F6B6B1C